MSDDLKNKIKQTSQKNNKRGTLQKKVHQRDVGKSTAAAMSRAKANISSAIPQSNGFRVDELKVDRGAMAIALPSESSPVRFGSGYSAETTAVARTFHRLDSDPSPSASSSTVPAGNRWYFLFRDYLRAAVIYDPNSGGVGYRYNCLFSEEDIVSSTFVFQNTSNSTAIARSASSATQYVPLSYAAADPGYSYQPHGPGLYCGMDGVTFGKYLWCDYNANLQFVLNTLPGAGESITLHFDRWDGGQINTEGRLIYDSASISLTQTFTIPEAGYYAISYIDVTTDNVSRSCAVALYGGGPVWRHLPVTAFNAISGLISGTRVNAVSFLYQNTSPVLEKNGQICARQIPKGLNWYDTVLGGYESLSSYSDTVEKPLETGLYTFLKPTQPADFDLMDFHHVNADQQLVSTHFPLESQTSYLGIAAKFITSGGQARIHLFHSIEYETTLQVVDLEKQDFTPYELFAVIRKLSDLESVYENPIHVKAIGQKILNGLKTGTRWIRNNGPMLASIAKAVGPMLATLL